MVGGAAHPRVSGENLEPAHGGARAQGSSPRERGKLAQLRLSLQDPRLIPA